MNSFWKPKRRKGGDSDELRVGTKIEMEHGLGKHMARKIAEDHLKEHRYYYSKGLIPMESRLKNHKGGNK